MAYIVIRDDWYHGYGYEEVNRDYRLLSGETMHEIPDEILGMFNAVCDGYSQLKDTLELMDKASRAVPEPTPPDWARKKCPECGIRWNKPSPGCPAIIYNRHPLKPYPPT